jgi:hypothetical protein
MGMCTTRLRTHGIGWRIVRSFRFSVGMRISVISGMTETGVR